MSDTTVVQLASSPYPGLRPFDVDEAEIFFGREEQTDQLLDRLQTSRFLAIVGPSGCGKSSLVRAGMIAALNTGLMSRAGSHWRIAQMRPGARPLWRLASALGEINALDLERSDGPTGIALADATLRRGPLGLVELLQEGWLPRGANLLVLVDQFEEIFRFRQEGSVDEADAFVALLLATAAQNDFPVYVALTMRSDFLGECAIFSGLPETINGGQYLTPRMSREQIRRAIVGPARVFDADVEPALVNRLLNQIGTDPDQLPLLQHALMRMWQQMLGRVDAAAGGDVHTTPTITVFDYEAVGAIAKALSTHANQVFDALPPARKRITELMFRRLTDRASGKRDTRRPAQLGDVAAVASVATEQVIAVAEKFRRPDRSFVTPPVGTPLTTDSILDIGHESLIRCWDRLSTWVDEEAKSAEIYLRLKGSAIREQVKRAALWHQPDLDEALTWREHEVPNLAWATRYGNAEEFELAMRFLDRSEAQARTERAAVEQARREKDERERLVAENRLQRRLKRVAVGFSIVSSVLMLAAVLTAVWAYHAESKARDALLAAASAKTASESLLFIDPIFGVPAGLDALLALAADKLNPTNVEARRGLLSAHRRLLDLRAILQHDTAVTCVAFSPDGTKLASAGWDKSVTVWDALARKPLGEPLRGHEDHVMSVAFSPDGSTLASAGSDKTVRLWNLADRRPLGEPLRGHTDRVSSVKFSPDGTTLASGSFDNTVILWSVAARQKIAELRGHSGAVRSVAFSPDGKTLASGSFDGTVILWDVASHRMLGGPLRREAADGPDGDRDARSSRDQARVLAVAFSADGKTLASGTFDNMVTFWDPASRQTLGRPLRGNPEHHLISIDLSPDANTLVSSSREGVITLWNLTTRTSRSLSGHGSAVLSVAISPDGKALASAGWDRTVALWDITRPTQLAERPLGIAAGHLTGAAFSPNGAILAFPGKDNTVALWNVTTLRVGERLRSHTERVSSVALWNETTLRVGERLRGHTERVSSVAFSPDGRMLASGSVGGVVILWDAAAHRAIGEPLREHKQEITSLAFSPDGKTLASASDDRSVILWNVATRQPRGEPLSHRAPVSSVAFSRDGGILVAAGQDGTLTPWDVLRGRPIRDPLQAASDGGVTAIAFSPDDRTVVSASGGTDGGVVAWDVSNWKQIGAPVGNGARILGLLFYPDGESFASVGNGNTIMLWDTATRQLLGALVSRSDAEFDAVALSPDGKMLATIGQNESPMLWDASSESWRRNLCGKLPRNLARSEWSTYVGADIDYHIQCADLPVPANLTVLGGGVDTRDSVP